MLKKVKHIRNSIKQMASRIQIPRYKNVSLYNVWNFYFRALVKGRIGQRSAGISFKFLTALFPMVIFLFTIIPFIPINNLQGGLMNGLKSFFPPQIFSFLQPILINIIHQKHTVLLSVGFILSFYFASNAVVALINGLNASHYIQTKHKYFKTQFTSLIVMSLFMFLFIISFIITSGGQYFIDYLHHEKVIESRTIYLVMSFIKSMFSILVFMLSISIVYNIANTEKMRWKFFNAGAIISTALIIVLKSCFGMYLSYFGKFDQLYGPIGAALAFLIFLNYLFVLLIIGFELNVSLEKAYYKKNFNFEVSSPEIEAFRRELKEKK